MCWSCHWRFLDKSSNAGMPGSASTPCEGDGDGVVAALLLVCTASRIRLEVTDGGIAGYFLVMLIFFILTVRRNEIRSRRDRRYHDFNLQQRRTMAPRRKLALFLRVYFGG